MSLQGCHKCGKHPNHPTEAMQSYKIYRCNECSTVSCNQHLIGILGNTCPSCKSTSITCMATRDPKASKSIAINSMPVPESTATPSFGARQAPLVKNTATSDGATFTPAASLGSAPGRNLSSEFVESMLDGGAAKIKAEMITHVEEHHEHAHEHTHEAPPQLASSGNSPVTGEGNTAAKLAAPAIASIEAKPTKETPPEEAAPAAAPAEDLPDPASLRSGTTIYTDACFRPSVTDKMVKLSETLEDIADQLESGKNIKVLTLALDYTDVKQNLPQVMTFLQEYPFVRLAVGYSARHATDSDLDLDGLQQFINTTPHVVALDTGLDLHFAAYAKDAQIKLLQKQIEIANHLGKPIYLSSVKGDEVLLDAIHQPIKGVFVSPLTSEATLEVCKKHNLWVCARSEITHKEQETYRQLLAKIPTGKVLIGSGSELVVPAGQKGLKNSPLYIDDMARVLMQLYRYQKLETVYTQCYKNLYGLLMGL